MSTAAAGTNTVNLHFIVKAPPERVFKAFIDPEAQSKWSAPHGFTCKVHEMDARVGGRYRMSFTNFTTGESHAFGGTYVEIIPNEHLRYNDQFEDPSMPGKMNVTVTFKQVLCGTEVRVTQDGLPAAIPLEFCYAGWQESIQLLKLLVEAEIKAG